MMLGKTQEAREAFAQAPAENVYRLTGEAILDARLGDRAGAVRKLEQLRSRYGDSAVYQQAEVLAQMGQRDQAFSALTRALEVRDPGLVGLKSDIFLDPLRSDARFAALEEKLGFTDSF
jgi:tetratricopeptide (TPR) repeat protein